MGSVPSIELFRGSRARGREIHEKLGIGVRNTFVDQTAPITGMASGLALESTNPAENIYRVSDQFPLNLSPDN